MSYLKGALHVHTNLSDGLCAPEEMAQAYRSLGFNFMAVTDHDYMVGNNRKYFDAIPPGAPDFLIFKGIEVEWAEIRYHHISKIWGEEEMLVIFNHPEQYSLEIEEVQRRIEVVNRTLRVNAVEVTHKGRYSPEYHTEKIALPQVATDDAHHPAECGQAWVEVKSRLEKDEIIRAIKAGDFEVGFKEKFR